MYHHDYGHKRAAREDAELMAWAAAQPTVPRYARRAKPLRPSMLLAQAALRRREAIRADDPAVRSTLIEIAVGLVREARQLRVDAAFERALFPVETTVTREMETA